MRNDTQNAYPELLKSLRKGIEHLYFKIMQDVEGEVKDNILYLHPKAKASFDMLSKPDVLAKYQQMLFDIGFDMELRCVEYFSEYTDTTKTQMQELSSILQTDIKIK